MNLRTLSLLVSLGLTLVPQIAYSGCDIPAPAPTPPHPSPSNAQDVYTGMVFSKGEVLRLAVTYFGLNAGFMEFRVMEPALLQDHWLMGFDAHVTTGEWYEKIFKAHDEGIAHLYPVTFLPFQFRLIQDHTPLIGRRYWEDKMLKFDTANCDVVEEYNDETGKVTKSSHAKLEPDAIDILAALYKLRMVDFKENEEARVKVFTSEKNWWLTATREDFVHLTVPAGKFDAVRLRLQTYIGKELQQKGRAVIWIAFNHPNKPLLKISADIKIGSFVAVLTKFTPGN